MSWSAGNVLCVLGEAQLRPRLPVTTYTDQSTWAAAAGSSSVETFESAATGNTVGPTTYTKSLTDFSIAVTLPDSSDYADVYSSSGAASLGSGNYFGWSGECNGRFFSYRGANVHYYLCSSSEGSGL